MFHHHSFDDLFPEGIATPEEMSQYIQNIDDQDEGLVYYDKTTNAPCGIASTNRGFKNFGPLPEGFIVYQGGLNKDYYPHGNGFLYNGDTLIKANFLDGRINSTEAVILTEPGKGFRKTCYLLGMTLY